MAKKLPTRIVHLTDEELTRRLTELETRHGMTSAEFLLRYNSGDLGDDLEFIHWSGLLRMAAKTGFQLPTSA